MKPSEWNKLFNYLFLTFITVIIIVIAIETGIAITGIRILTRLIEAL